MALRHQGTWEMLADEPRSPKGMSTIVIGDEMLQQKAGQATMVGTAKQLQVPWRTSGSSETQGGTKPVIDPSIAETAETEGNK